MTARDFCYWLQGYFEIGLADKNKGAESLSYQQTEVIQRHLAMVFAHEIDPSHGPKEGDEAWRFAMDYCKRHNVSPNSHWYEAARTAYLDARQSAQAPSDEVRGD